MIITTRYASHYVMFVTVCSVPSDLCIEYLVPSVLASGKQLNNVEDERKLISTVL